MIPEQSYWPYFLGIAVLVTVIMILLVFYVFFWRKESRENHKNSIRYQRILAVLHTGHVHLWTYDVKSQVFSWVNRHGNTTKTYTAMELSKRYPIKDFENLRDELESLLQGKTKMSSVVLRAKDDDNIYRDYVVNMSVLTYDEEGHPLLAVGTESDITDSKARQMATADMMLRYKSVFNISMTDMALYDADGYLVDFNEKVCETFNGTHESILAQRLTLAYLLEMSPEEVRQMEYFHATLINRYVKELDEFMFYEMQVIPIYDDNHQLQGYFGTGISRTESVLSYRKLKNDVKSLVRTQKDLTGYISNINYLLQVGGVRMVEYSPDNHVLTVFKGIEEVQIRLTQARCMTLLDESAKKRTMRLLNSMDEREPNPITVEVKTVLRTKNRLPLILQVHVIPVQNALGYVTKYFGLCRDVSEVKETERQLEIESIKAQDLENVKNVFLRNMSFEIRTPLATVVGFAELFDMEHSSEEESFFIEQIKSNSNYLLTLINDILFLSRLDAKMIEIKPRPTDIAALFDSYCQLAWANHQKPGVEYVVENHYKKMEVEIDEGHVSNIIHQIVTNASQHTREGRICARYDYIHGHLVIVVEDTGDGIAKEDLPHIFERFASKSKNGTGLGLPISKELTEQMGGNFEINSELGRGTTVWISIPCKVLNIERKERL
jgi:signal transduction histidine kinase